MDMFIIGLLLGMGLILTFPLINKIFFKKHLESSENEIKELTNMIDALNYDIFSLRESLEEVKNDLEHHKICSSEDLNASFEYTNNRLDYLEDKLSKVKFKKEK